jgi:hypothetical protein
MGYIWIWSEYVGTNGVRFHVFSDSDWVGSTVDRKITSGSCFSLGSTVFSWFSKKKMFVALSSVEVEYKVGSLASYESILICKLLAGLFG